MLRGAIDQKPIFNDDIETERRGGHLALGRPAKDSVELDKWNAAGEFKAQPVAFVDADGRRTERVSAPDPLLARPDGDDAVRKLNEKLHTDGKPTATSPLREGRQSTAGDGRERQF